jgi:hypothetical protein
LLLCDRLLDRLARRVQDDARLAVAYLAQGELQRRPPPEVCDAGLVELRERTRTGDRVERLAAVRLRVHGRDCIRAPVHRFLLSRAS